MRTWSGRLAEHWGAGGVAPLVDRDDAVGRSNITTTAGVSGSSLPTSSPEPAGPARSSKWSWPIRWPSGTARSRWPAEHGPLAGYVVAGHFCAPAAIVRPRVGRTTSRGRAQAEQFCTNDSRSDGPLAARLAGRVGRPHAGAGRTGVGAVAVLRRPEPVVLLRRRLEPTRSSTPGGPAITLSPLSRSARTARCGSPWTPGR